MYHLYWARNTGAFFVQVALNECRAEHELIHLDYDAGEHKVEDYRAINPLGEIPAMRLPDGSIITETVAMILHLSEAFPESDLLPPAGSFERARACRWLMFMATNTYTHDLRYYYSDRFTTEPDQTAGIKARAIASLEYNFELINQTLADQPYLTGDKLGIADAYLAMLAMWHPGEVSYFSTLGRVFEVVKTVKQRPVVADIWQQNFPGTQDF